MEVFGPTADKRTWAKLDQEVARTWEAEDGRQLRLARVAVDSGDGENTMEVYQWARRHPGFAMAVKGRESIAAQQAIGSPTWQDVTVNGRKLKRGVRLWNIGTSMLKMELYGQLGLDKPVDGEEYPDGYIYLPDGLGDEWIKQLVAEELRFVKLRNGGVRREWHKVRDRNEALDNAIYARAISVSLGIDQWKPKQWARAMGEHVVPRGTDADGRNADPSAEPTATQPNKPKTERRVKPRRDNPYTSRRR